MSDAICIMTPSEIVDPRARFYLSKRQLAEPDPLRASLCSLRDAWTIFGRSPYGPALSDAKLVNFQSAQRCSAMLQLGGVNYVFNDLGLMDLVIDTLLLDEYTRAQSHLDFTARETWAQPRALPVGRLGEDLSDIVVDGKAAYVTGAMINREIMVKLALPLLRTPRQHDFFADKVGCKALGSESGSQLLLRFLTEQDAAKPPLHPSYQVGFSNRIRTASHYILGHELSHIVDGEVSGTQFHFSDNQKTVRMFLAKLSKHFSLADNPNSDVATLISEIDDEGFERAVCEARHDSLGMQPMIAQIARLAENEQHGTAMLVDMFRTAAQTNVLLIYRRTLEIALTTGEIDQRLIVNSRAEAALRNLIVLINTSISATKMGLFLPQYLSHIGQNDIDLFKKFIFFVLDMEAGLTSDWPQFVARVRSR